MLCGLPGMSAFLPLFPGDSSKRLLILRDGLPERLEQGLRIDWVADNPSMKLSPRVFGVVLAEVEDKLEGVVAHLEVVGISPFEPARFPRILISMSHRSHQVMLSNHGNISHAQKMLYDHESQQGKSRANFCWYELFSSHCRSVTGGLRLRPRRPSVSWLEMSQRVIHNIQPKGSAGYSREVEAGRVRCQRDLNNQCVNW
jgi:hypothetical protein